MTPKDPNLKKDTNNSITSSLKQRYKQIAIVGASYAGLTLGNILQKNSIPFQIFESYPNYYHTVTKKQKDGSDENLMELNQSLFVIGRFVLPSFACMIQKLGIPLMNVTINTGSGKRSDDADYDNSEDHCYERCNVILTLLNKIQDRVQYSTTITSITKSQGEGQSKLFYCVSDDGRKYGPFDYIVKADGVNSIINSGNRLTRDDDSHEILVIGDARWVNNSWYDFGYYRIKEGANCAINDAYELGLLITNVIKKVSETKNSITVESCPDFDQQNDLCNFEIMLKQKFSEKQKVVIKRRNKIFFHAITIVTLLAFIIGKFTNNKNEEQIFILP